MNEYRITFGVQYPREPHPTFPGADGNGWLTIIARDEEVARLITHAVLGTAWAFLYAAPFDEERDWQGHFPAGELTRIDASLALVKDQVEAIRELRKTVWEEEWPAAKGMAADAAKALPTPWVKP